MGDHVVVRRVRFAALAGVLVAGASLSVWTRSHAFAQGRAADYLPLAVGARWELTAPGVANPMVFDVTGRDGDAYVVRWDNPWIKAQFRFVERGEQVLLAGLDMGAGNAPMPAGTVYFDFGMREGGSWSNGVGRMTVVSRDRRVTTPSGTYDHVIEIRATDRKGADTLWFFAPNVGFVQFGDGTGAFRLSSLRRGGATMTDAAPVPPVRGPRSDIPDHRGAPLVGIDFNPTAQEGFDEAAKRKAFKRAVDAGMTFMKAMPSWYSLEAKAGEYNFSEVDFAVSLSDQYRVPLYLNVRVIDTGNKSVPPAYAKLSFDDAEMTRALERLLRELGRRSKNRVRWIAIGNETDSYLKSRGGEIEGYARMLDRVRDAASTSFPGALFTVNFTRDAASDLSRKYKAIADRLDILSFNYYPLNINFTMRDPSVADGDIAVVAAAAGSRPFLLQEIGYASAERLKSSEEKQAQFYRNAFGAMDKYRGRLVAANFLFMSDLPESTVEDLAKYYRLPFFKDNFKAYIGTLGLFDRQGRAKPAWEVFRQNALRLARAEERDR